MSMARLRAQTDARSEFSNRSLEKWRKGSRVTTATPRRRPHEVFGRRRTARGERHLGGDVAWRIEDPTEKFSDEAVGGLDIVIRAGKRSPPPRTESAMHDRRSCLAPIAQQPVAQLGAAHSKHPREFTNGPGVNRRRGHQRPLHRLLAGVPHDASNAARWGV